MKPNRQGRDARVGEVEEQLQALLARAIDPSEKERLHTTRMRLRDIRTMLATNRMDMSHGFKLRPDCYDGERSEFPDTEDGADAFEVKLEQEVADIKAYVEREALSSAGVPSAQLGQQVAQMQQLVQQLQQEVADLKGKKNQE